MTMIIKIMMMKILMMIKIVTMTLTAMTTTMAATTMMMVIKKIKIMMMMTMTTTMMMREKKKTYSTQCHVASLKHFQGGIHIKSIHFVWVFFGYSSFLPQVKDMQIKSTGHSKLPKGVNVIVNVRSSLSLIWLPVQGEPLPRSLRIGSSFPMTLYR